MQPCIDASSFTIYRNSQFSRIYYTYMFINYQFLLSNKKNVELKIYNTYRYIGIILQGPLE